jgi:hypothetical protein
VQKIDASFAGKLEKQGTASCCRKLWMKSAATRQVRAARRSVEWKNVDKNFADLKNAFANSTEC